MFNNTSIYNCITHLQSTQISQFKHISVCIFEPYPRLLHVFTSTRYSMTHKQHYQQQTEQRW